MYLNWSCFSSEARAKSCLWSHRPDKLHALWCPAQPSVYFLTVFHNEDSFIHFKLWLLRISALSRTQLQNLPSKHQCLWFAVKNKSTTACNMHTGTKYKTPLAELRAFMMHSECHLQAAARSGGPPAAECTMNCSIEKLINAEGLQNPLLRSIQILKCSDWKQSIGVTGAVSPLAFHILCLQKCSDALSEQRWGHRNLWLLGMPGGRTVCGLSFAYREREKGFQHIELNSVALKCWGIWGCTLLT